MSYILHTQRPYIAQVAAERLLPWHGICSYHTHATLHGKPQENLYPTSITQVSAQLLVGAHAIHGERQAQADGRDHDRDSEGCHVRSDDAIESAGAASNERDQLLQGVPRAQRLQATQQIRWLLLPALAPQRRSQLFLDSMKDTLQCGPHDRAVYCRCIPRTGIATALQAEVSSITAAICCRAHGLQGSAGSSS